MALGKQINALMQERKMQTRGLLWLALLVLLGSVARAGLHNAFPAGWWRLW
jgi:hypothetical protein